MKLESESRVLGSQIWLVVLIILQGFLFYSTAGFRVGICMIDCEQAGRSLVDSATLKSCLAPAGAQVVLPSDPGYTAAKGHMYNNRSLYSPAAFVFATSVAQVQNAVKCAVQLNIGISPRGGGHSYEDYSLGGRDGVLVVDLERMNKTTYSSKTKLATVQAGSRLGPMKLALWNQGKVTTPSGTCPSVGVAGHALGGGWGFVSRKFGIMADAIVEAQVVTANGTVVTASATKNADLFFALRGAGANSFGIVTQFKFRTFDVSSLVTYFFYNFDGARQADSIRAYQKWGLTASAAVSASLYHDPSGGNFLWGVFLGPKSQLKSTLQTFFDNGPPPTTVTELETDYITAVVINAGFKQSDPPSILDLKNFQYETRTFKSKSIFVKGSGFSEAGISAYVAAMKKGPSSQAYFIFDLFGGSQSVINSISSSASSWVHRDSLFSIQMLTAWDSMPGNQAADVAWIEGIWNTVRPYSSSEAYQNYIDSEMTLDAYYGSNLARLKSIKSTWDPSNVFNYQQSIPLNSM